MTQIEALKLALDEIKRVKEICLREVGIGLCNEVVIAKLEEALAQPEQEPVAWKLESGQAIWFERTDPEAASALPPDVTMTPLYTTPPTQQGCSQRPSRSDMTWVGLTDEEYKNLHLQMGSMYFYQDYGRAIESKLKEKNT